MELKELIKQATPEQKKAYGQLCARGRKDDADKKAINTELKALLQDILTQQQLDHKADRFIGAFWKQLLGGKKSKKKQQVVELEPLTRRLPYPLGYKLREFLVEHKRYENNEGFSNFPYLLASLNSLVLRTLALFCIAEYVEVLKASDPEVNRDLKEKLQTPSDGIWKQIFESITSRHKKDKRGYWIPRIAELLRSKQPITGEKKPKSTTALLQELIEFRNKLLHEPQQFTLYSPAIREVAWKLKAVCGALVSFQDSRILAPLQEHVVEHFGNAPEALEEEESKEWQELEKDRVYLIAPKAGQSPLSLHPFLCHTEYEQGDGTLYELYFLNGWHRDGEQLEYISFGNPQSFNHVELGVPYSDFEAFLRSMHLTSLPPARLKFYRTTKLHSQHFFGREKALRALQTYAEEIPRPYGLLYSPAAMGKTALLSVLHDQTERASWPAHLHVLWHFCDPTDNRIHPVLFLRSILAQMDECTVGLKKEYPSSLEELQLAFRERLLELEEQLAEQERMVLIVDGLDEALEVTGGLPSIPELLPEASLLPDKMGIVVSYRIDEAGQNERVQEFLDRVSSREQRISIAHCSPLRGLNQDEVEKMIVGALPEKEFSRDAVQSLWMTVSQDGDPRTASPAVVRFIAQGLREGSMNLHRPESLPQDQTELFERFWHALPMGGDFLIHRLLGILAFLPEHGDDDLFSRIFTHLHRHRGRLFTREDIAERRSILNKQLLFSGDQYRLVHSSFRHFVRSRFRPQEQGHLLLDVLRADKPERLRALAAVGDAEKILALAPWGEHTYRRFQYLAIGAMWMQQAGFEPTKLFAALERLTHLPLNPSALILMEGVLERAGAPESIGKLLVAEEDEEPPLGTSSFDGISRAPTGPLSVDELESVLR